jgi:hypothetical protein
VLCKGEDGEEVRKPIEEVKEGDEVWAYYEVTGESGWKEVKRLFRNGQLATDTAEVSGEGTRDWCHVTIKTVDAGGKPVYDTITSTLGHKYFVPFNTKNRNPNAKPEHDSYAELGVKWVSAEDLKKGDKVLLAEADALTGKQKYGIVAMVKGERHAEAQTTYNLEVEGYHTFYVGQVGTCVHNAGGPCSGTRGKIFDSADDAYAAARNDLGLKPGEKPLKVINQYYDNGKGFWSNQNIEVYGGNRAIANHSMGHFYSDTGQFIPKHYNVGIWNTFKGRLTSSGFHFFY